MTFRVKDLMNLPDAIMNELETRSQLRAEAAAHNIVNKLTGSTFEPNPYSHNPYRSNNSSSVSFKQNIDEIIGGKNG
jgi:hypothetical protein